MRNFLSTSSSLLERKAASFFEPSSSRRVPFVADIRQRRLSLQKENQHRLHGTTWPTQSTRPSTCSSHVRTPPLLLRLSVTPDPHFSMSRSSNSRFFTSVVPSRSLDERKRFQSSHTNESTEKIHDVNRNRENRTHADADLDDSHASGAEGGGGQLPRLKEGSSKLFLRWKTVLRTWQFGLFGGLGLCTAVGTILALFWKPLRSDASQKTRDVASDVLSDTAVKEKALEVTKAVVEGVLKDDASVDLLVDVIGRLLQEPSSLQVVALYLKSLFEDKYTQEISKHFVLTIVQDQWVYDQLCDIAVSLALDLLKNETTRQAMITFLIDTSTTSLKDDSLQATAGSFLRGSAVTAVTPPNPLSFLWGRNGSDQQQQQQQEQDRNNNTVAKDAAPANSGDSVSKPS